MSERQKYTFEPPTYLTELAANPALVPLGRHERPHSWVHHNPDKRRLDIHYYFDPVRKRLHGGVHWGPDAEGPPGCGHGGSIASVLDDGMGTCAWAAGHRVVALSIQVNFRHFVPLGSTPRTEFWVERAEGRKIYTAGQITGVDGTLHAESTGLFLEIDFAKLLDTQRDDGGPIG